MKTKIFMTIALTALLTGGFAAGNGVTQAGAQSPAQVEPPAQPAPPEAPTFTCPKCGTECPMPQGRRGGHGMRAPKAHHGYGKASRMHAPRASRNGRIGMSEGVPADRMLRGASRLELSDGQIAQLEKLSYDSKSKLIDLNASLEKARLEMRKVIESNSDDMSAMKKNLETMSKIKVEIQALKLENWIAAKKVLTDEQKQKIKDQYPRFGSHI